MRPHQLKSEHREFQWKPRSLLGTFYHERYQYFKEKRYEKWLRKFKGHKKRSMKGADRMKEMNKKIIIPTYTYTYTQTRD